jgi:hypothetical protein
MNSLTNQKQTLFVILIGVISMLGIAVIIIKSPMSLVYDEPYHLSTSKNVLTDGWKNALLNSENKSAAGPLFSAIQNSCSKITNLKAPSVRWINYTLLLCIILINTKTLSFLNKNWLEGLCQSISILSVPFLWPTVGMALTEVPALLFFCCFTFFLCLLFEKDAEKSFKKNQYLLSILAGACLGISILGRQTYLVAVPCLLIFITSRSLNKLNLIICATTAILISGWLFVLWGGLVPPSQVKINSNLKIEHGLYSLAYVGFASAIVSPKSIFPKNVKSALYLITVGIPFIFIFERYNSPPAYTVLVSQLGEATAKKVGLFIFACMIIIGLSWLVNTITLLVSERCNPLKTYFGITLLALAGTPVGISHMFSSRYSVGLLGLLLFLLRPPVNWFLGLRILIGSVLGAVILLSYY